MPACVNLSEHSNEALSDVGRITSHRALGAPLCVLFVNVLIELCRFRTPMLLLLLYYVAISRGGMCIYKCELKKRTVRLPMGDEKRCCRLRLPLVLFFISGQRRRWRLPAVAAARKFTFLLDFNNLAAS
jgi:hypothetical protein